MVELVLASSLAVAIATIALGIALMVEGPLVITPVGMMLAPTIGTTQTIQIEPEGEALLTQQLNLADKFISELIVQGGTRIILRIDGPVGSTVRSEAIQGQEYVLDYKIPKTGIYTIHLQSNSNVTSYVVTRTVIIRAFFGVDATTVIGAALAVLSAPIALQSLGYFSVMGRRGLIKPKKVGQQVPANQTVMITAPVCDEYEILVTSFLGDALKEGKSVFYVSLNSSRVEELYKKYPNSLFALICDTKTATALQGGQNLEVSPGVADLTGLDITASKLLAKIGNGEGIVAYLDIVSDVLLRHSLPLARKWLTQMLAKLKGRGITVLAGVNPAMLPAEAVAGVIDLFDGYLEMTEIEEKQQVKRYLKWVRRPHGTRKQPSKS